MPRALLSAALTSGCALLSAAPGHVCYDVSITPGTDLKHSYGPKRGAVRNIGQSLGLSSVKGNRYKKDFARM